MTTTHRTIHPALAIILAGVGWDLIMTTVFFSAVDISDRLWFLLDAPGMALIAIGFARYSRRTLPVAAAFGLFAAIHLVVSTDPDPLGFLLGPADLLIAVAGVASTIWITRTEGWGARAGGLLAFTVSILVIGPLLAIYGDAGLSWGLPLYSVCMLAAWLVLRQGSPDDTTTPVRAARPARAATSGQGAGGTIRSSGGTATPAAPTAAK